MLVINEPFILNTAYNISLENTDKNQLTLVRLFDELLADNKFDSKMAKKLYDFQIMFITKNNDHAEFFGGSLTGIHILRFTDKEYNIFYHDILDVNIDIVKKGISYISAIKTNWKLVSDTFNLLTIYTAHRMLIEPSLNPKQRYKAAADAIMLFNYRTISASITQFFKYPADPEIAKKAYEHLSARFILKQLKSWQAVLEYRAKEVIESNIHKQALIKFSPDEAVIYLLTDTYGRLKDMVKNIAEEFYRTHKAGEKIKTSGNIDLNMEGEEVFSSRIEDFSAYNDYILSIIQDKNTFVKNNLVNLIQKIIQTTSVNLLTKTLMWISSEYYGPFHEKIDNFIKKSLEHLLNYLNTGNDTITINKDITAHLIRLKGMLMSSRSTNPDLIYLRKEGYILTKYALNINNDQLISSTRTGVMMYIFIRAYSKDNIHK